MLLLPFYPVEMVRASSRVTTILFPYFYHFWFARKMPFCIFMQSEIRGEENTGVLEWENQYTCRRLVTGLDP